MDLCNEFGIFGPIASVKIMWPRGLDSSISSLSGFVSFMERADAAKAIAALDGKVLRQAELRVGWGKPIKTIPQRPYYIHPELAKKVAVAKGVSLKLPGAMNLMTTGNISTITAVERKQEVCIPDDLRTLRLIHRMAERVIIHGAAFEAAILLKEKDNPLFTFLTDPTCSAHLYYRWRVYSLLQGDSLRSWSLEPFKIFEGDMGFIVPPSIPEFPMDQNDSDDEEEAFVFDEEEEAFLFPDEARASDTARRNPSMPLSPRNRGLLEDQLRDITIEKGKIADCMFFCMRHCYAMAEILALIEKSIFKNGNNGANGKRRAVSFTRTMAKIFLLSDILHNSGNPMLNAWKYRNG